MAWRANKRAFRWRLQHTIFCRREDLWIALVKNAQLDEIKDRYEPGDEAAWTARLIEHAKDLDTVRWLREHGARWNGTFMARAAETGNIPLLQYGLEKCAPYNSSILQCCVAGGMRAVEWAMTVYLDAAWPSGARILAIESGDLQLYRLVAQIAEKPRPSDVVYALDRAHENFGVDVNPALLDVLLEEYADSDEVVGFMYSVSHISLEEVCARRPEFSCDFRYRLVRAALSRGDYEDARGLAADLPNGDMALFGRLCTHAGVDLRDSEITPKTEAELAVEPRELSDAMLCRLACIAGGTIDPEKAATEIILHRSPDALGDLLEPTRSCVVEAVLAIPDAPPGQHGCDCTCGLCNPAFLRWLCTHDGDRWTERIAKAATAHPRLRVWLARNAHRRHLAAIEP